MVTSSICKSLLFNMRRASPKHKFHILQLNMISTASSKVAEKPISENINQSSFVVNYLKDSCGLSLERAISASKHFKFKTPDKPNAKVSMFMNKGFTHKQITRLVSVYPRVLQLSKNNLLKKIDFFESKGFSEPDLPLVLLNVPDIFTRSLEKYIIPTFSSLKDLLGCENNVIIAVKRWPMILTRLQSFVVPNIEILREVGVPEARIAYMLRAKPSLFTRPSCRFKVSVEEVKKMGINLTNSTFIVAFTVVSSLSRSSWKEKVEVYKRWGFSDNEVLIAFKRYPWCMMASKAKIEGIMDVLVNEIGLKTSTVLSSPNLLAYSLKKKIIPRHSLYQVLLSKGLIKKQASMVTVLAMSERSFVEKFVIGYENKVPDISKLYQEMLET